MFSGFKSKAAKPRKVTFEHYAPGAEKVELSGSFNGWNHAQTPLVHDGKGRWKVVLELMPGRYEYRYRVDGGWQNDQRPVECIPNPFGTWNCVIEVH